MVIFQDLSVQRVLKCSYLGKQIKGGILKRENGMEYIEARERKLGFW
jgi:hypothetical protein